MGNNCSANQQLIPICGKNEETKKIKGRVVLTKKSGFDASNTILDRVHEFFGKRVSIQLISATNGDPGLISVPNTFTLHGGVPPRGPNNFWAKGNKGKIGKAANLEKWTRTITSTTSAGEAFFQIAFDWDETMGVPGAFIIKNNHHSQFYIKSMRLDNVPGYGPVHFECNSWVYPAHRYEYDRIFFSNKAYLPGNTPELLRHYREQELINLRGNGSGVLREWDRVYDYAFYNDLGLPDKGRGHARPVLGGSEEYPYPRRGRTGRPPTSSDPNTESRLPLLSLNIYVPKDERFGHIKMSDFLANALKSIGQVLVPEVVALFDKTPNEFDTFEDVIKLYKRGIKLPNEASLDKFRDCVPWEMVKELMRSDGERFLKLPMPAVIRVNNSAWRTDEEFAREMLAGLNPVVIRCLQKFPPPSKLDAMVYGNQHSSMTREQVERTMDGLNLEKALLNHKLFILDHHDALMPYLRRINTTTTKTYASRTLLLLKDDGTLKPLAIELSLPHQQGDTHGCTSQVFTPANVGVEGSVWQLAKAYAAVNDSGYHQLISHWLNTHAVIEPIVIATNRQLSVLHPIHKLLHPHFRDTMYINALARQILINAGGVLEKTVFPAKYAMEMSSFIYKSWNLTDEALPADLLKRGMAVPDSTQPHGLKLLVEDYPYAVDGLDIWSAIETWVREYCSIYYQNDQSVESDIELQAWWTEVRTKGHGDKRNEPWWPNMHTYENLTKTCTTIIWIASALHAALNFGQYAYAGYLPNRPTVSRRFMPEPGTREYAELAQNAEAAFLKTITAQLQTLLGVSLIELLSRHTKDEVYLGRRESVEWTEEREAREAFDRFGKLMVEIEGRITERNNDVGLKNRYGTVAVPYTLLYPSTSDPSKAMGLSGMGIPNSVSM